MAAFLTTNRPRVAQWYDKRNRPLTGCTVLHTSEGVMDDVGPDTGTDNLARFIQGRTTAGSYHDIVDSDSNLQLIEYHHGAFHDGTGSNNWALSLSFVCRTVDWDRMSPERRRGFLRQGALAFARQQEYRRQIGAPLTALRRISKAQSDRGESGFVYHGDRDPGRRSDPGVSPPNDFPIDEFINECRAVMSGGQDDDMELRELVEYRPQQFDGAPRSLYDSANATLRNIGIVHAELAGLRVAVEKLADAVASGRDDLTADELREAVAGAIQDAGAALRAASSQP